MLPSLALALLCLLRAGAEVPVKPDFSTEKVTAQSTCSASSAQAGGAGWGRGSMLHPWAWLRTPRHSSVLAPS